MRNHLFLAFLLSLLITLPAQAQVYKWKDAQGRTVISDTPQPGAGKQAPVANKTPAASESAAAGDAAATAAAGPKNWAEKDLEFKQRQQEKKASAEKAAKEKAEADQRKDNCNRAQEQQRTLESGQRISRMKTDGEREVLDDQQRQQEIEKSRKNVQEWCK